MGTMLAVKGNKTTTGGEVLDGDESFLDANGALAKDGGLASCERCGRTGPMLGTAKGWELTNSTAVNE